MPVYLLPGQCVFERVRENSAGPRGNRSEEKQMDPVRGPTPTLLVKPLARRPSACVHQTLSVPVVCACVFLQEGGFDDRR
ncbi:hypothetical protein MRX96_013929 [Rhipicephalus microplus]